MSELAAILIVVGSAFCGAAALGILRFPDLYTRLHAASKAGPVGAGLILLGAGIASGDLMIFARSLFGLVFLILTSPVSAHLLARAARRAEIRPSELTSIDEQANDQGTV